MKRLLSSLAFCVALSVLATGCDVLGLGDDYDDLTPGTFRFHADGETYTGTATYRPRLESGLSEAAVYLVPDEGPFLFIGSDTFLTAEAGDRIEPDQVQFRPPGAAFGYVSGEVTITSASADHIEGQFDVRLEDNSIGPVTSGDISAEGGFYAQLEEN